MNGNCDERMKKKQKIHEKAFFLSTPGSLEEKLVKVKFSGLKPISTFHSNEQEEENSTKNFPHSPRESVSVSPYMQLKRKKEIYLLFAASRQFSPFVTTPIIHQICCSL